MRPKTLVVLLAIVLAVTPIVGQTLTEQLQKGIYTEETLGNPDEAARIYRQIISAPSVPQTILQQASGRLAQVTARQRSQKTVALQVGGQAFIHEQGEPLGIVENGRYHHVGTGIEFGVPSGWDVGTTVPSSDSGEQVMLTDRKSGVSMSVWMIKLDTPTGAVPIHLENAPTEKVKQRLGGYLIPGMVKDTYQIPPHTVQPMWIGGRQAVLAIGEYIGTPLGPAAPENFFIHSVNGEAPRLQQKAGTATPEPMSEYMTWIYTEDSRAFFFARVATSELAGMRARFDQIIQSAFVP